MRSWQAASALAWPGRRGPPNRNGAQAFSYPAGRRFVFPVPALPEVRTLKTLLATAFALTAFAANSVLCRLALGGQRIDAVSFTAIRLLSGLLMLAVILRLAGGACRPSSGGSWKAGAMLATYAVLFSFAYLTLDTGTGALLLFAAVQLTMIFSALTEGERLHGVEWGGVLLAFCGFVYLMLPTVRTPSFTGFILMTAAGVAWGLYTLAGRNSRNPLQDTAGNFIRTWPVVAALSLFVVTGGQQTASGVTLAVLSGAVASGIGYAVWYLAIAGLTTTQAAVVQLLVPVLAGVGGVLFAAETLSLRLIVSAGLILGGIMLVVLGKRYMAGGRSWGQK